MAEKLETAWNKQGARGTGCCYWIWRWRAVVYEAEEVSEIGSDGRGP